MTAPDSSSSISDRQSQGLINALEFFIFHCGTFWCLLCRRWIFTLLLSLCLTLVSLNCSTIPPNLVAVQLLCFVQRANLVVGSLKTSRKSGRNFSWYLSFTPFTWFTYPNWICSRPLSTKRNSFITHTHTHRLQLYGVQPWGQCFQFLGRWGPPVFGVWGGGGEQR